MNEPGQLWVAYAHPDHPVGERWVLYCRDLGLGTPMADRMPDIRSRASGISWLRPTVWIVGEFSPAGELIGTPVEYHDERGEP